MVFLACVLFYVVDNSSASRYSPDPGQGEEQRRFATTVEQRAARLASARMKLAKQLSDNPLESGYWATGGGSTQFIFPAGQPQPMILLSTVDAFAASEIGYSYAITVYEAVQGKLRKVEMYHLDYIESNPHLATKQEGTLAAYIRRWSTIGSLKVRESKLSKAFDKQLKAKLEYVVFIEHPKVGAVDRRLITRSGEAVNSIELELGGDIWFPTHPGERKYLLSK